MGLDTATGHEPLLMVLLLLLMVVQLLFEKDWIHVPDGFAVPVEDTIDVPQFF